MRYLVNRFKVGSYYIVVGTQLQCILVGYVDILLVSNIESELLKVLNTESKVVDRLIVHNSQNNRFWVDLEL